MAEVQVKGWGTDAAPNSRTTKDSEHLEVLAVEATFDGTGAAGSWIPAVQIVSDSGDEVGTFPLAGQLEAGDSVTVTFAPFLGSGGGIKFDQPNSGGYLDVTTTGADASGYGFQMQNSEFVLIETQKTFELRAHNTTGSQAVGIIAYTGNIGFTSLAAGDITLAANAGSVQVTMSDHFTVRDHNGQTVTEISDIRDFTHNLKAGRSVFIKDNGGNTVFRIDNDGTIHGLAAVGAITWDL